MRFGRAPRRQIHEQFVRLRVLKVRRRQRFFISPARDGESLAGGILIIPAGVFIADPQEPVTFVF